MSSSLSVLLVPLQELQAEGHCTSTVVGGGMCVLSHLYIYIYIIPSTFGSGSPLHCKSVFCYSAKDVQTDSRAFLEPVQAISTQLLLAVSKSHPQYV